MKNASVIFVRILIITGLIVLLLPYCYGIINAFPVLDDFDHAIGCWDEKASATALKQAFDFANEEYMTWSGTYLLIFFENLLSPLHFGDYNSRTYGVFALVIFFAFVAAFMWSIYTIITELCFVKREEFVDDRYGVLPTIGNVMGHRVANGAGYVRTNVNKESKASEHTGTVLNLIAVISLATFLLADFYPEATTMFNGAMQYKVPGIFGLMSIAFMARYFGEGHYGAGGSSHDRDGVLMTICGILACMQLSWCIPIGLAYAYFWIRDFWTEDGLHPLRLVPLGFFIAAGASVVLAPGQSARASMSGNAAVAIGSHASEGGFITLLKAVWHTTVAWSGRIAELFTNPIVVAGLVILFFTGMTFAGAGTKNPDGVAHNIVRFIVFLIMSWGVAFPTCIGYGSSALPDRVCFSVDLAIIFSMTFFLFRLGQQFALLFDLDILINLRGAVYAFVIVLGTLISIVGGSYKTNPWYVQTFETERIVKERQFWIGVMDEITLNKSDAIKTAKETGEIYRMVIERDKYSLKPSGVYVVSELTEDGTWPNASMARWLTGTDQINVGFIWK